MYFVVGMAINLFEFEFEKSSLELPGNGVDMKLRDTVIVVLFTNFI